MRALGIDLGERRIGIAVSDATGTLARPLRTLERRGSDADTLAALTRLIADLSAEEPVGSIIVGLPRRLDGSDGPQTARALKLVSRLRELVGVPVDTQDERLSSHEADARLAVNERDWRRRKARLDAAAAAVILQDYLDARPAVRRGLETE